MNALAQAEEEFFEAQRRIFMPHEGDAAIGNDADTCGKALLSSPARFTAYPYRRFTRQEARVLEIA